MCVVDLVVGSQTTVPVLGTEEGAPLGRTDPPADDDGGVDGEDIGGMGSRGGGTCETAMLGSASVDADGGIVTVVSVRRSSTATLEASAAIRGSAECGTCAGANWGAPSVGSDEAASTS